MRPGARLLQFVAARLHGVGVCDRLVPGLHRRHYCDLYQEGLDRQRHRLVLKVFGEL